jgi:hypothetical protein
MVTALFGRSVAQGFGLTCISSGPATIAAELKLNSARLGSAWNMIGPGALFFSIVGGLTGDRIRLRDRRRGGPLKSDSEILQT